MTDYFFGQGQQCLCLFPKQQGAPTKVAASPSGHDTKYPVANQLGEKAVLLVVFAGLDCAHAWTVTFGSL